MAHGFVRWVSRRALHWFYRDVRIVGSERIPQSGPVLLVGNHPNDLPDVLLGFLATRRPVRYVATAAAATSILVRWMYEGLGVIPVTRVKDARKLRQRGADMASANRVAFERVTQALVDGAIVGVFPEGGVYAGPGIGPMRSGVAKLALESTIAGAVRGLTVVAIGCQYEAPAEPGSDVLAVVGDPVSLDVWLESAPAKPHIAFTTELRRLLEAVSRTAITASEGVERDRMLAAAGASIAEPNETPFMAAARIHDAWVRLQQDDGAARAAEHLCVASERAGGRATSALDCRRVIAAASGSPAGSPWRLIVLAPLALVGLAMHAPVHWVIWWLSKRVSETASDRAARAILPGLYLMFVWYAVIATLLGVSSSALVGPDRSLPLVLAAVAGVVLLLPRLGDFAVAWRRDLMAFRLDRRVRRWSDNDRAAVRHSMHTLRAAWVSHLHGSAVSVSGSALA